MDIVVIVVSLSTNGKRKKLDHIHILLILFLFMLNSISAMQIYANIVVHGLLKVNREII